jgi:hypothetical protein
MGQVTIYLEEEVERQMTRAAKAEKLSKSKWVAKLIRSKIANDWPDSIAELAGSWGDLPLAEELRADLGQDVEREQL